MSNNKINLDNYSQDEMYKAVSLNHDISFNELCSWLDDGVNLDFIKECLNQ
jgi:hypothetical protein